MYFSCRIAHFSRLSVVPVNLVDIVIHDASACDTIWSVKERVFALNRHMYMRRQRLYFCDSIEPLADEDTLGRVGVAQDGSARLVLLLRDLSALEEAALGEKVQMHCFANFFFNLTVITLWSAFMTIPLSAPFI
jgi:hypothetical protein